MNPLEVYTSTGIKLLHHPDAVKLWKERGIATPISLQVAPTSLCNLKCQGCSNTNRERDEEINHESLIKVVYKLKKLGLKTIEWTGGGEPTLWDDLGGAILEIDDAGIEQGLISNGTRIMSLYKRGMAKTFDIDLLKWLRVSLNSLDYVDELRIGGIPGTLGFSYFYNGNPDGLRRAATFAKNYKGAYLRVVPNCLTDKAGLAEQDAILTKLVSEIGPPAFYQPKEFKRPSACYWGWFKPFINTDSWVYPCSSVVLNSGADRHFHRKYRICHMTELPDFYNQVAPAVDTQHCDHCVFWKQNEQLAGLLFPNGMENFI